MQEYVTDQEYAMNSLLRQNLDEVPIFLKKAWDCVLILSGHGKVRIGKSTLAAQIGYYLAWKLRADQIKKGLLSKDAPLGFSNENIAFDPDTLMKIAYKLPKHSVIIYDEGRAGLDSARAMENINKIMQSFFQEIGQKGHIIIIVLPNFFKLSEDIAVSRSLFLIDVYTDRNYNRGWFSFYNEGKKELLYVYGKMKKGNFNKYNATNHNFYGTFTKHFPLNEILYKQQKLKALKKNRLKRIEMRWKEQRDAAFAYIAIISEKNSREISEEVGKVANFKISQEAVKKAILKYTDANR